MYRKKKLRVAQMSKEAFLYLQNQHRIDMGFDALPPRKEEKLWQRAVKYAPAATETSICIEWDAEEVKLLKGAGYTVKQKHISY